MIDPIGAFNRIRGFYISYLETAFYIRDRVISRERRQLLETAGSLCTEPIIEPITRYRNADFKLHELMHGGPTDERVPGLGVKEREAFVRLALSGLFETEQGTGSEGFPRAKHRPYIHQAEMLRRGVVPGNPTIVTSGTGSGKTEAFLLPVASKNSNQEAILAGGTLGAARRLSVGIRRLVVPLMCCWLTATRVLCPALRRALRARWRLSQLSASPSGSRAIIVVQHSA